MCGIAGLVDLGGLAPEPTAGRLSAAVARLRPRGPDGEGTWRDAHVAFGHTRLAIIDLGPGGAQPMQGHGRVITFNGEIYNYRHLRRELEAAGHHFTTRSDTEVILAGWRAWGPALLPRLTGMFAFALWDPAARELVLARDRFGKKPLLFHHAGERLAFASDLVALEHLLGSAQPIDHQALRLLFTLRYVPEPRAIAAGVAKVPAGHLARFRAGSLVIERWFDLGAERGATYGDEGQAGRDLVAAFDAAVADRLVADVPVGAFLSGGIDSALVAAAAVRAGKSLSTFTVGFAGAPDYYEERPAARVVAEALGTDHHEVVVDAGQALASLDSVFDGLDEPFADSSAVNVHLLARAVRPSVKVVLTGDGADELFAGYRKHQGELWAGCYQRLPATLRHRLIEPLVARLPEGKSHPLLEAGRRLRRFTTHAGGDAVCRQAGWARLLPETDLERLFAAPVPGISVEGMIADLRAAAGDVDSVNRMLAADIGLGLVGDMLVKVDRMSMASGLEVRCPFLDQRVALIAAAMPGAYKLAPGAGKRILRRAFADRLPAATFRRPKRGLEVPIATWLQGPLAERVRAAIDPVRLARQGLFRPELPAVWWRDLCSGVRDTAEPLWTLIAFQAWAERRGVGAA
ncbi:MAG: asparagine synthase (glutamine-hydrolyzing) [Alphaproteobacteria bacterium]|nr:asparagine synthase (glutamine-hydrolyzing) [Alphaproteobacteria bacterium]